MDRLSIVRRRLHGQRLAGDPCPTPAAAVRWLGAVQAQEYGEAKWSVGQRVGGARDGDVEESFARGEILRTHVLRPTWHFVAPEDIRWMLRLTAPRVHARAARAYHEYRLDADVLARSRRVLAAALDGGAALTRRELADRLRAEGIDAGGPRLGHLMMHAELEQLICSGPRRGAQHTYALLDDRVPPGPELTREDALAELALRYFTSRGPATLADFSWWSGLTAADGKAGLDAVGERLRSEIADDGRAYFAASAAGPAPRTTGAFLIPTYDEAVIAYREARVAPASGPVANGRFARLIVHDGRTIGSWERRLEAGAVVVEATPAAPLSQRERHALEAAVRRFGRFLGRSARLELAA